MFYFTRLRMFIFYKLFWFYIIYIISFDSQNNIHCKFQRAEDANKLEENQEHELLENSYVEFEIDNEKMREYHIDTNPTFHTYPKILLFRIDLSITRPIMMIGKD